MREYAKLLADCREAKSGAEKKTMNGVVQALMTMESPLVVRLKHKLEIDALFAHNQPTPREDLDWMMEQLESLIAEMR